jgi:O-antigen/teichoic acid export membrane protein
MSEIINQSLQKIAKGSVLVFLGSGIGMLLAMVVRIIIARQITQEEYGAYSIALVVINTITLISLLGLDSGITRQIAFYRHKDTGQKIHRIILTAILVTLLCAFILAVIIYLFSDILSTVVFHTPILVEPLSVMSISIPFSALVIILSSVFRGFEHAEPSIYFQNIARNLILLLFVGLSVLLGLQFGGIIYAFVISSIFTCLIFYIYSRKKLCYAGLIKERHLLQAEAKELLLFSTPLFAYSILSSLMLWVDTLVLGLNKSAYEVGLYNSALPIADLIFMVLTAVTFLYVPFMTKLFANRQTEEIKRSYIILTKWLFAAIVPLLLVFTTFPDVCLTFLFGSRYVDAAPALQILAIGFFVHSILALSGYTLVATGNTRFLLWSSLCGALVNVFLNILLIPPFGIVGAAIATAIARIVISLLWTIKFYQIFRIQPFTLNYLKPSVVSILLTGIIYLIVKNTIHIAPLWLLPILLVVYIGIYGLATVFTKSFDKEDIMVLISIEKRLGWNLQFIKKILAKFI